MRKTLLLAMVMATGFALAAQQRLDYYSPTKNIEVHGTSGIITLHSAPKGGKIDAYHFDIRSGSSKVHAIVHDEGLEFFADRVQGDATGGSKMRNTLTDATGSGGVKIVKTATGSRSEITSTVAKYTRMGTAANLDMTGPIKLTNYSSDQKRNLVATGSSAVALLATDSKAKVPLRTATLRGPVAIDIDQPTSSGGANTIHARGDRLDIDNTKSPARLVLSGGVTIDSPQFGHWSGINRATLSLNEKGEVTSIETTARGGI